MNKRILFGVIALSVWFQSCISDYTPIGVKEISEVLVVDGTITNGTSAFKLSRSVGLTDFIANVEMIDNANISVESEDGTYKKTGRHLGNGSYTVETEELSTSKAYRLHIRIGEEEYASGFLQPMVTPAIDSIFWHKKEVGEPVNIYVATHDSNTNTRYYRWSYLEDWEIRAEYFANAAYIDKSNRGLGVILYDLKTPINRYYCWGKDSSKVILLDSSEKLSENIITRKKLLGIPVIDDRLSVMYYIKVRQNSLRKEAYNYFQNIQKNIEQTGSIFSPIPSETKGNITCLSNPETPVIGYVEVSTSIEQGLYIPYIRHLYEPLSSTCRNDEKVGIEWAEGYDLFQYFPPAPLTFLPPKCVNCLLRPNASKNKPEGWPTDHL